MKKINSYSNIVSLARPGIFAFVHYRTKSMYITYSNNMLTAISSHITQAQDGVHSNKSMNKYFKNLRLYVIEECDSSNLTVQHSYWWKQFEQQGYKFYNTRPPLQYKVRTVILVDYSVQVQLINKNREVLVLGVFDNIQEANTFQQLVQSLDPIRPLYYNNLLTKSYHTKYL